MIKSIIILLMAFNFLFSAQYIPENLEDILDINEKKQSRNFNYNKMTYKEFIEYRWENNIEHSESWGTEIMYEIYILDNTKDIYKVINLLDSNINRLTTENLNEIEEGMELSYSSNIINEQELNIFNDALRMARRTHILNRYTGQGNGGKESSSSGGGDGDDDGDDD